MGENVQAGTGNYYFLSSVQLNWNKLLNWKLSASDNIQISWAKPFFKTKTYADVDTNDCDTLQIPRAELFKAIFFLCLF